jgi:hypothetical protein
MSAAGYRQNDNWIIVRGHFDDQAGELRGTMDNRFGEAARRAVEGREQASCCPFDSGSCQDAREDEFRGTSNGGSISGTVRGKSGAASAFQLIRSSFLIRARSANTTAPSRIPASGCMDGLCSSAGCVKLVRTIPAIPPIPPIPRQLTGAELFRYYQKVWRVSLLFLSYHLRDRRSGREPVPRFPRILRLWKHGPVRRKFSSQGKSSLKFNCFQ